MIRPAPDLTSAAGSTEASGADSTGLQLTICATLPLAQQGHVAASAVTTAVQWVCAGPLAPLSAHLDDCQPGSYGVAMAAARADGTNTLLTAEAEPLLKAHCSIYPTCCSFVSAGSQTRQRRRWCSQVQISSHTTADASAVIDWDADSAESFATVLMQPDIVC